MKILVVDDSSSMRRIIINALSSHLEGRKDFHEAADGVEAIEKVKQFQFDLILMDWNMPKMSGLDAIKKIRSFKLKMPIIMVTANNEKDKVITALKSGANNYVTKPFKEDILIKKYHETMDHFRDQMPASV